MSSVVIADLNNFDTTFTESLSLLPPESAIRNGDEVFLKPNLTYPVHRPGVTTSPHFMEAVIRYLTDLGARVSIGEGDGGYGAWSADISFAGHGLKQICSRYGARLINLSTVPRQSVEMVQQANGGRVEFPGCLLDEFHAFVTLPVPKVHAITTYSGAVKNQWGCLPNAMRLTMHPQFTEIIWALNERLRPRLVIADGQYMLDVNGPLWGQPVYMNRLIVSDDVLACDVAVMKRVMHINPARAAYLAAGSHHGFSWNADRVVDRSSGHHHRFTLKRTLRNRLVAFAFPRQWAVNLLWDSRVGDITHRAFYLVSGNPVDEERRRVEAIARGHDVNGSVAPYQQTASGR